MLINKKHMDGILYIKIINLIISCMLPWISIRWVCAWIICQKNHIHYIGLLDNG